MKEQLKILKNGIFKENPTMKLVLGMCPTIAITTSATNGFGMGMAVTFVLVGSNCAISLMRNFIPDSVRIPAFIVIIASFVTVVELLMKAYLPALDKALGIFIPLIVVNCIILARAESFASQNSVGKSILDGIGMGLGFTLSLLVISCIRELIGSGTLFGTAVFSEGFKPALMMALAPGGFLTLGLVMGLVNLISNKRKSKGGRR